jgi:hypothetical protein
MRVFDAVGNLAQLSGRLRKPDTPAAAAGGEPPAGPLAHLEQRLAGVLVAALSEAFDRDRARMDLERSHLEAERARAEAALRAELRRQANDRAIGQIRLIAIAAVAVWMLSAAMTAAIPGLRTGAARLLLGSGWACVIATLGCALSGWQRVGRDRVNDESMPAADAGAGFALSAASWLLLAAIALSGAALLVAL